MKNTHDALTFSVCVDCYMEHHHGDTGHNIEKHIQRELDGKGGHLSGGIIVDKPDNECEDHCGDCDHCDDFDISMIEYDMEVENDGYEEFSWTACDLCRSPLGGSRHGMTLFIEKDK